MRKSERLSSSRAISNLNLRTGGSLNSKVKKIPATISMVTAEPLTSTKKRRGAGYARVSTENEEQQSSYEAQMDYYSTYLTSREDWEFVGMYSEMKIA